MSGAAKRASRGQLLHKAYETAWQFKAYDAYGRDPATALRSLRRRCPGFSAVQYRNALDKAIELYDATHTLVREDKERVWAVHEAGGQVHRLFDEELGARFPAFRKSTFHAIVGMTFYYWHLR